MEENNQNKEPLNKDFKVPKLRFDSFEDRWKTCKISSILKIKNGRDYKTVEVLNGKYGVYGTGGLITKTNKFLINKPTVCIGRKGTIDKPLYFEHPIWTVDTLFFSDIYNAFPKFVYYLFLTINWKIYNQSTGVPSLTSDVIENITIHIPRDLLEQTKISIFLSAVDCKIHLLNSKISTLKKYKEGLVNLCFCDGKKYKISSFVKQVEKRNKDNQFLTVYSISNKKGFISQAEQFDGNEVASMNKANYKIVHKNEFAYNPARINVGSIAYLEEEIGQISPMYIVFSIHGISNILLDEYFHSIYFRKELRKHLEGSVRQSLSFENLCDFNINISNFSETFGLIFKALNCKLSLLEKTLSDLKKIKSYLLENMFI